jgi:hypothetical protein
MISIAGSDYRHGGLQNRGIVSRFLRSMSRRPARPDAAGRLIETYDEAVLRIEAGPRAWLTHPRPYPALAVYGFRWIKVHRYWFGYAPGAPPVITNIFDEASDMPRQISADDAPTGPA